MAYRPGFADFSSAPNLSPDLLRQFAASSRAGQFGIDPTQTNGVLSGQQGVVNGPLSGNRDWRAQLGQWLDPQVALPIAAQLIGGANLQDSLAGGFQAAGQAIPGMKQRAALNAYMKSQSGLGLTPEEQQLLQSDPELGRAYVARQLTPKPPITVGAGDRLYDPTTGKFIDTGAGGGGYAGTSMDAQNWNIILQGKTDTPEYAAAYNQLFQTPKMASGTGPNNEITQTPYYPDIPPGVKPPAGVAPAAPGTPSDQAAAGSAAGGGPRVGKAIVTGQKAPTETAARAAGLYAKAAPDYQKAVEHFDALKSVGNQALDYLGLPGRMLQSSEYQVARNAAKSVVASYQYAASGASAPEEEVQRNLSLVMPDPSDGEAAIADKKARLSSMMQAMQIVAQGGRIPPEMVKQIGIDVAGPGVDPGAGAGAAANAPGSGVPARITGDADYNALPSGAHFIGPDGHERVKP